VYLHKLGNNSAANVRSRVQCVTGVDVTQQVVARDIQQSSETQTPIVSSSAKESATATTALSMTAVTAV